MKTITELRNHVYTKIKLDGYEHDQIFEMLDLFENGLQDEVNRLNLLYKEELTNLYLIARIETLNNILK
jgi:hypothetical protein